MALYANYIANPSFELSTTEWSSFNGGSLARVGQNASAGSYSMRVRSNTDRNVWEGVSTIVDIAPAASQPYSVSLNISGATEQHGSSYSGGTRVTVYDLLPGQNISQRQQRAQQTFSRSTNGRVAVRNVIPRSDADRLVVVVETSSTYFQSGSVSYTGPFVQSGFSTYAAAQAFAATKWNTTIEPYSGSGGQPFYRVTYYNQITSPEVSGGQATVYVDAVKVEQGAIETSYVDGGSPGYVWSGTPHASPTLNVAQLEASGSMTMGGPDVEMLLLMFMQSAGEMIMTGDDVELAVGGTLEASGDLGTMDGTVELWNYGPLSSDGSMGMGGDAILATIVEIEAEGEMSMSGDDVEIKLAWPLTGSGDTMVMDGTVEITFPQPISASGDMTMTGAARADIGWPLIASGEMWMTGVATLDEGVPAGAFRDFAIYGTTDADPLKLGRGPSNAGTNSGANEQPWVRIHGEFYAPAEQPHGSGYTWRRAAYAAVGFKYASVPAGNAQELACVQLEPSASDDGPGPRDYMTAKTIRPLVWADRINYSVGEWWTFFGSVNVSVVNGDESPFEHDPHPIKELTINEGADGFFGDNIINPPPNSYCVTSMYVRGDGNIPSIFARVLGDQLLELGRSETVALPPGEWVRLVIPFITDASEQRVVIDLPDVIEYPAVLEVAGVMTERGTKVSDYFHFVAGTQDYYYRYNGSDPSQGAFYYRNREERVPLLVGALEEHMPLSIRVGEPEFGLVPYLDA